MGGPPGTMTLDPPARPTILPSGVSRHVSPANVYQASGPECRCAGAVIPGVKIASIYCAEYFASELTGSGPISATRDPPDGCHPATSTVRSHTLPSDSTTVPRAPLAVSAWARVG